MARSYYSTVFAHDADAVWAVARDFNGLATFWPEAVSFSEIEAGKSGDQVNAIRNFKLGETGIRERLVAHSDLERTYTYEFCEPKPFPVENYFATLRVTPVADGSNRAFVEYWAVFDPAEAEREHWTRFFAADVFAPVLTALAAYLAS